MLTRHLFSIQSSALQAQPAGKCKGGRRDASPIKASVTPAEARALQARSVSEDRPCASPR
jgi:hypothetical protein